jgi:TPR repeat protein
MIDVPAAAAYYYLNDLCCSCVFVFPLSAFLLHFQSDFKMASSLAPLKFTFISRSSAVDEQQEQIYKEMEDRKVGSSTEPLQAGSTVHVTLLSSVGTEAFFYSKAKGSDTEWTESERTANLTAMKKLFRNERPDLKLTRRKPAAAVPAAAASAAQSQGDRSTLSLSLPVDDLELLKRKIQELEQKIQNQRVSDSGAASVAVSVPVAQPAAAAARRVEQQSAPKANLKRKRVCKAPASKKRAKKAVRVAVASSSSKRGVKKAAAAASSNSKRGVKNFKAAAAASSSSKQKKKAGSAVSSRGRAPSKRVVQQLHVKKVVTVPVLVKKPNLPSESEATLNSQSENKISDSESEEEEEEKEESDSISMSESHSEDSESDEEDLVPKGFDVARYGPVPAKGLRARDVYDKATVAVTAATTSKDRDDAAESMFQIGVAYGSYNYPGMFNLRMESYNFSAAWVRLAAEKNHVEAQFLMGLMHQDELVPYYLCDPTIFNACEYYWTRAANNGHVLAMKKLAKGEHMKNSAGVLQKKFLGLDRDSISAAQLVRDQQKLNFESASVEETLKFVRFIEAMNLGRDANRHFIIYGTNLKLSI